jgi:HAMP domain-containing protein
MSLLLAVCVWLLWRWAWRGVRWLGRAVTTAPINEPPLR